MLAVEPPAAEMDGTETSATTSTAEMPVAAVEQPAKRTRKRAPKRAATSQADAAPAEPAPELIAEPAAAAPPAPPPEPQIPVTLRPWSGGDLPLLGRLMGDPAMTHYLGGPENPKELRERQLRYTALEPAQGKMYVVLAGEDEKPAGSVGYWETETPEGKAWETGWSVLPEYQRLGVATKAAALVLDEVRALGRYRTIHAYPLVGNAASNAVCRKLGFSFQREVELESRRANGEMERYNDWCCDLTR
jgi:RimJ/RimL family protein N-acetyltransferase